MNFKVLLISTVVLSVLAHCLPQTKNPKLEYKSDIRTRGWKKPKPCWRPGSPGCSTEETTSSTRPTISTIPSIPTTASISTKDPLTPSTAPLPSTESSTNSNGGDSTTANPPDPTIDEPHTFATTSSPDLTPSTTVRSTTTSRRPRSTPSHDGGMVFPDDDDDDGTHPWTTSSKGTTTRGTTTTQSTTPMTIESCMQRCPVRPENDPVCGTDAVTYKNPGQLKCAQSCGVPVDLASRGPCRSSTTPKLTTMTTPTTVVSTPDRDEDKDTGSTTPSSNVFQECIRRCPVTPEYNPVCGTDGVTYGNIGRLNCAKMCGNDVAVLSRGPCSATTPEATTVSQTTPAVDGNQDTGSTTPSNAIRQCISRCSVTSEYNPVCGTDGITYNNPGRLECARSCGKDVSMLVRGPCGTVSSTSSRTTASVDEDKDTSGTTTPSTVVRECMRGCPVTSEYSPVCGTDGVTYNNPGRLICAKSCGINVDLGARGPCNNTTPATSPSTPAIDDNKEEVGSTTMSPEDLARCIRTCPVTHEYNPLCGTNGVTYKNMNHFNCAQNCKADVAIKHYGKCPKNTRI